MRRNSHYNHNELDYIDALAAHASAVYVHTQSCNQIMFSQLLFQSFSFRLLNFKLANRYLKKTIVI